MDLSLRKIVLDETKVDRHTRMLLAMADMGKGSRDLLEPGARTVAWTCMVLQRAGAFHACSRPEDGWAPKTFHNGVRIGSYTPGSSISGALLAANTECYGQFGKACKELPIAKAAVWYQHGKSEHVGFICAFIDLGNGLFRVFSVEGGQPDGPLERATHSWTGDASAPVLQDINDGRIDDHAQRFARLWRRRPDGCFDIVGADGAPKPGGAIVKSIALSEGWPILHEATPSVLSLSFTESDESGLDLFPHDEVPTSPEVPRAKTDPPKMQKGEESAVRLIPTPSTNWVLAIVFIVIAVAAALVHLLE